MTTCQAMCTMCHAVFDIPVRSQASRSCRGCKERKKLLCEHGKMKEECRVPECVVQVVMEA